jgi:hypothetical protein
MLWLCIDRLPNLPGNIIELLDISWNWTYSVTCINSAEKGVQDTSGPGVWGVCALQFIKNPPKLGDTGG